ncbi:hypothetical protein PIB30_098448, partial [Stylosanthes scabra]|nr:hypothetical protein [Stylosanthes scabra]
MRGRARICVLHQVKSILCTHRRRRPRICVVDQLSTPMRGKTLAPSNFTRPRICVVESIIHAYVWKAHSSHVPESRLAHSKRELSKGSPSLATITYHPSICIHSYAYAWDSHPLATDQHPTHTTTQTNTLHTST